LAYPTNLVGINYGGFFTNELIKVVERDDKQAVSARDLHGILEVGRDFSNWIKDRIEKYGFAEGEDYSPNLANRSDGLPDLGKSTGENLIPRHGSEDFCSPNLASKSTGRGGHNKIDYLLSVGMAKEIAIVENNEKGREIRRYLIKVEEAWNSPEMVVRRAVQLTKGATWRCIEDMKPAGNAVRDVYKLQDKYRHTEKIAKRDVLKLFRCAIVLKDYYYDVSRLTNELILENTDWEEKVAVALKWLAVTANYQAESDDAPKLWSEKWLGGLWHYFHASKKRHDAVKDLTAMEDTTGLATAALGALVARERLIADSGTRTNSIPEFKTGKQFSA
jgi:phage anti-repressor protein